MSRFRYPQFCAIARAAEVLGERWTLLILRELFIGPQRFSDLRRHLDQVSTSVLSERLTHVESLGIVRRRELEPPAASSVYELDEHGLALRPVMKELVRWGARFLAAPRAGERFDPNWLIAALTWFARRDSTTTRSYELRIVDGARAVSVFVAGGSHGTVVDRAPCPVDLVLTGSGIALLGIASGGLEPSALIGDLGLEGDVAALAELPSLFEFQFDPSPQKSLHRQPNSKGE